MDEKSRQVSAALNELETAKNERLIISTEFAEFKVKAEKQYAVSWSLLLTLALTFPSQDEQRHPAHF
jgi:hypothetical protein